MKRSLSNGIHLIVLLICFTQFLNGQYTEIQTEVAINKSGGSPDPTAILDIKSQTQGVLLPRMTALERTQIVAPQTGLLVYDLDLKSLFYFDGDDWVEFGSGRNGIRDKDFDTSVKVEEAIDEDMVRIKTRGTERVVISKDHFFLKSPVENTVIGDMAGGGESLLGSNSNTVYGYQAGNSILAGRRNTLLGMKAGNAFDPTLFSDDNTLVGFEAGVLLKDDSGQNTIVGASAHSLLNKGNSNVIIGHKASQLNNVNDAEGNIFIGASAGGDYEDATTVDSNVVIGFDAGQNLKGSGNIMIGSGVGSGSYLDFTEGSIFIGAEPGSLFGESHENLLCIDNETVLTPLILGDFSNDWLGISGALGVGLDPFNPTSELMVQHNNISSESGFTLQNYFSDHSWRLYTESDFGYLRFYSTHGGNGLNDYVAFVNDVTGSWTTNSDRRVKRNIAHEPSILNRVNMLEVVSYKYKRESAEGHPHIGLIAQDVEPIFPSLVTHDDEGGLYSLSYAELGPIAIKAIQELSKDNDILTKQNEELSKKVLKLENLYEQLQKQLDYLFLQNSK